MNEKIIKTLEIIEKLESRINAYWNFYTIIVVANVGWLMSAKTPFSLTQSIALTIALSVFFLANFSVMRAATKRVVAFESELNAICNDFECNSATLKKELSSNSMPGRLLVSTLLHLAVDTAVIYSIWSKLS
jgi:hypothetical protein